MRYYRNVTLAFLALSCCWAQSGHWEGVLQAPSGDIRIVVDLTKSAKGEWAGAIAAPEQDTRDVQLQEIAVQASKVTFAADGPRGHFTFAGSVSADGKTLSGTISAMGQEMPCEMTQTGKAKPEAASKNTAISKDLEGDWQGVLDVNGNPIHIKLHLANGPNGATGSAVAVEQGGSELAFNAVTQKESTLKMELAALNGVYSGDVSADRQQIVGNWTQGEDSRPLTFKRPAK